MARGAAIMCVMCSFVSFTMLALLTCSSAHSSAVPKPEKVFSRLLQRQREASQQQRLNTTALNTALAFEPYRDLANRTTAGLGVQEQHNILFSPLGLASALALMCRVSGSQSRSQVLEALGMAANSTEQSVEAIISALTDLQRSLTLQVGGGRDGLEKAESEAGAGSDDRIGGATAGTGMEKDHVGNRSDDGVHVGGQLRVWSSLHVDGKSSIGYESFLSRLEHTAYNTSSEALMKDLQTSDELILNNYVYFKGVQLFEKRHTVLRRFQLNATASVEVAMMFQDDSHEMMMLYDTNCSATVVRLAYSERLASLLLLPKAEMQPLEDCLSDGRMSFWLSNLKTGRAEILFPKFQLRKSYSLKSLLRKAGVSSIFSQSADFSGISQGKTLKLIKAPHEVMLEVEESKSEEGGRPDIMLDFSVPPRITFDRPFMLIIYDELTGLVLLIGRIINPKDIQI